MEIKNFSSSCREYLDSMRLLQENLPTREMRTLAYRLVENSNNPKRTWGCFLEGVPVGALVGGQLNNNVSYLEFIWLDPKLRQEGYGIQLLNTFENQQRRDGIKRIETEVYDSRSLEWAKRQGYQVVHKEGNMSCLLKLLD